LEPVQVFGHFQVNKLQVTNLNFISMESLTTSELLWYVLAVLALGILIGAGFTWLKWKAFHRKEIAGQIEDARFREDELFKHIQSQEALWENRFRNSKEA